MKDIGIFKSGMVFLLLTLLGCGGSSSSAVTPGTGTTPAQVTKINGIASKGPINGGTVSVYKIVNNAKGDLIVSGITGPDGAYSLDVGSYSGSVLLEISGGTYTDEATGITSATIPTAAPLHAVVAGASGTVSAAITPLTELAYQLAGSTLTPAAIDNANKQVAGLFKVNDITKTQPVSPAQSSLAASSTTQAQRDYTLMLATFSQVAATKNMSVADTVSYLKSNITGSVLSAPAVTAIQEAAVEYFRASNAYNTTGVTDPSSTNLVYIVPKQILVKISTVGTIPSGNFIKGMQFEINMPAGVSVKSDSSGLLAGYLLTSGVALTASSQYIIGNITGSKLMINFVNSSGILIGEFATLTCDVADNTKMPTISSFLISSGYQVTDLTLNKGTVNLSAVTVAVSSVVGK